jgi:predicted porin
MYRSPIYSGLQGQIGYSFNAGAGTAPAVQQEVPGFNDNQSVITGGLLYNNGPITAAATYEKFNCPGNQTAATASTSCSLAQQSDQQQWTIGGTFDLKIVKFAAAYGKEKNAYSTFTTIGGNETIAGALHNFSSPDATNYMLGATVPLGGGRVLLSGLKRTDTSTHGDAGSGADVINSAADDARAAAGQSLSNNLMAYAVGYEYDLSKRTILWVYGVDVNGKDNLNQSVSFDRRQYALGIRHAF